MGSRQVWPTHGLQPPRQLLNAFQKAVFKWELGMTKYPLPLCSTCPRLTRSSEHQVFGCLASRWLLAWYTPACQSIGRLAARRSDAGQATALPSQGWPLPPPGHPPTHTAPRCAARLSSGRTDAPDAPPLSLTNQGPPPPSPTCMRATVTCWADVVHAMLNLNKSPEVKDSKPGEGDGAWSSEWKVLVYDAFCRCEAACALGPGRHRGGKTQAALCSLNFLEFDSKGPEHTWAPTGVGLSRLPWLALRHCPQTSCCFSPDVCV